MNDAFYNYQHVGREDSSNYPEPISMEPNYQEYQQLKEPATVLYDDYYNAPNDFRNNQHHTHNDDDDEAIGRIHHNDDLNDPKMIMIRQINDDEKDWSEEDISDIDADAKNDTLPPPSLASTNQRNNPLLNNQNLDHLNQHNYDSNTPNYVNVNDLINNIGFGMLLSYYHYHHHIIFAKCKDIYNLQNQWSVDLCAFLCHIH